MGGVQSTFSNSSSGTGYSKEFAKITIDGSPVKGNSKEDGYTDYFEVHNPLAFHALMGTVGPVFDIITLKLKVCEGSEKLLSCFLDGGHKDITIEIVRKKKDPNNKSYPYYKTTYTGCHLYDILLATDGNDELVMDMSFAPTDKVEIELLVPAKTGDEPKKVGPLRYSIQENKKI